jgi:hypothetical protein
MGYPFITVTYRAGDQQYPVRLAVPRIVAYMPCVSGGSVIETTSRESYSVKESVELLDALIQACWVEADI